MVSKLNEVKGVKGLGRFFKQIAQSGRSGGQDDFLGSVNIPLLVNIYSYKSWTFLVKLPSYATEWEEHVNQKYIIVCYFL